MVLLQPNFWGLGKTPRILWYNSKGNYSGVTPLEPHQYFLILFFLNFYASSSASLAFPKQQTFYS